MQVFFTKHARDKFEVLERHNVLISQAQVEEALGAPDAIDDSHAPLFFAQRDLDGERVMRVAFKKEGEVHIVITFYPSRKKHYEPRSEE